MSEEEAIARKTRANTRVVRARRELLDAELDYDEASTALRAIRDTQRT
jgi:hypothetical protein